ncbi:MAG: response regulator [Pseudomonadota bacterium]
MDTIPENDVIDIADHPAFDRIQALGQVLADLRLSLANARGALEAYGIAPHAVAQLTIFCEHINQVRGVVHILELGGLRLLAEDILAATETISKRQDGFNSEEFEVLVRATLSLETYIEQTARGEAAAPLVLLPLLNDLRAVQQAPMLSEMALFSPNLGARPPVAATGKHSAQTMARRLRPYYQSGLLRWYNDPGDDRGLLQLTTIIHRMERASRNPYSHQTWWIARGLIDAVLNQAIELSVAVRVLFGKLDRVLKVIRDLGEDAFNRQPLQDLMKNMLYYIARAPVVSLRVRDIKNQYALDRLLPDADSLKQALTDLSGPMQNLPETIAVAIKEELARVKVLLDSYTYGERRDSALLSEAIDILKSSADTLTLLGMGDAQLILTANLQFLRDCLTRNEVPNEIQMLTIAEQLLKVEAVLNNLRVHLMAQPEYADFGSTVDSDGRISSMNSPTSFRTAPGAELRKIRNQALKQCISNFNTIKQRILAYVGDPSTQRLPVGVPGLLREIEGCLNMLEFAVAARLAGRLVQHIEQKILEVDGAPQEEFLDVLAEAIMSFEMFLETLLSEHGDHAAALLLVQESEAAIQKTASFRPKGVPMPKAKPMEKPADESGDAINSTESLHDKLVLSPMDEPAEPIDEEVIGIFFEEADEQVLSIREILKALNEGKSSMELLLLMQRICHTLNGSARIVQAVDVAEIAAQVEKFAASLTNDNIILNSQTMAVLSVAPTALQGAVEAFKHKQPPPDMGRDFLSQIQRIMQAPARSEEGAPRVSGSADTNASPTDLLTSFVVEVGASLASIRRFINDCASSPHGCRVTDDLIYTVKSITTNAATLDLAEIARLSSLLENFFGRLKEAQVSADSQTLNLLREFCNTIDMLVVGLQSQSARSVDTRSLQRSLAAEFVVPADAGTQSTRIDTAEEGQSLLEIFLDEVQKLTEGIESVIALLDDERRRTDGVAELLRIVHTIKGGARVAGIKPVGDLAHALESLLETVSGNRVVFDPQVRVGVTKAMDALLDLVDEVRRGEIPHSDSRLLVSLSVLQAGNSAATAAPVTASPAVNTETPATTLAASTISSRGAVVQYAFDNQASLADAALNEDAQKKAEPLRVNAEDLDQLVNFGGEGNILLERMEMQFRGFKHLVTDFDRMLQKLREQVRDVENRSDQPGFSRVARSPTADPLDLQHFTEQQQIAGELAGTVGELMTLQSNFIKLFHDANSMLKQQTKVHRSLHEGLLSARMVPFGRQAQRLQRLIRKTSEELGKKARLNLEGVDGKLDRVLLDRLMGPLEHILRNALAHGIESEQERRAVGKPTEGVLTVRLRKDGQKNILEVSDDGAGIDLSAVRNKALEKGLVRTDQVLSQEELVHLILEPGFSTAKAVTQIAGRGVGLDAANREILQMGGSLHVESHSGLGTAFTIVLPFTMAMHQVLLVRQGEQIFALPVVQIEHVEAAVPMEILERLYLVQNPSYAFNGATYHFWRFAELINQPEMRRVVRDQPLVLVKQGDYRAALLVDEILGERELFVKPAGTQFQNIPYVTGATVLGDGRVALILDIARLFKVSLAQGDQAADAISSAAQLADDTLKVLVVDDSVTVRKVTERFLLRHQMNVSTAKDGIEALQQLEEKHPDIVLLDIEMPRMDGFEFTKRIRHDQRWQGLPIIMISSRSSPKHISYAEELGVNLFLGKPYQETELLDHIYRLTTNEGIRGH